MGCVAFPFPAFVLAIISLTTLAIRADDPSAAGNRQRAVAVLVEPGLPIQGGIRAFPRSNSESAAKFGLKAQALSVSQNRR